MFEQINWFTNESILGISAGVLALQILFTVTLIAKASSKIRQFSELYQQLYGVVCKIEGLSAGKRALILYQMDNMLESLAKQLPSRIAAQAGERIFDTESQMLKVLSELEPGLRENQQMHKRLESLVHSMGNLESTIVSVTNDTVRQAMIDAKEALFFEESKN